MLNALEQLRFRLAEFADKREADQVAFVAGLRAEYDHSIELVRLASEARGIGGQHLSCYEWALRLSHCEAYWELCEQLEPAYWVSPAVIVHLVPRLARREGDHFDGDLVLYESDSGYPHAGVSVKGGRVQSKWSPLGCVWAHPPLEAPIAYGWVAGSFEPPPIDVVLEVFRAVRTSPRKMYPGKFGRRDKSQGQNT